ncbi:MAG: NADH-quinone oxidoreductase subunit H [Dermatophilaceae bacterium]
MTMSAVALISVQVGAMVLLAPVITGVMRQVRARMEGRAGAGIWQPWRDLRKQFRKEPLSAATTSWMSWVGPVVLMTTGLALCALVPLVGTVTLPLIPDDLFVVVGLLLLGTVALALVGLDAGTAFGGMGSSRHMTIAALVEPTVLLAVYALSVPVGTSLLSGIVTSRADNPTAIWSPVSVLAVAALAIAVIAEAGRLPVDNPATHLELTMVHEAMVLETSGRDLAWLELGSQLRLAALLGLLAALVAPFGLAAQVTVPLLALGVVSLAVKVLLLAAALAAAEVFVAKLRLFRVPELLAGSFTLALVAVTASYWVVTA